MKNKRDLSLFTEEIEAPATEGRAFTSAEAADSFGKNRRQALAYAEPVRDQTREDWAESDGQQHTAKSAAIKKTFRAVLIIMLIIAIVFGTVKYVEYNTPEISQAVIDTVDFRVLLDNLDGIIQQYNLRVSNGFPGSERDIEYCTSGGSNLSICISCNASIDVNAKQKEVWTRINCYDDERIETDYKTKLEVKTKYTISASVFIEDIGSVIIWHDTNSKHEGSKVVNEVFLSLFDASP